MLDLRNSQVPRAEFAGWPVPVVVMPREPAQKLQPPPFPAWERVCPRGAGS